MCQRGLNIEEGSNQVNSLPIVSHVRPDLESGLPPPYIPQQSLVSYPGETGWPRGPCVRSGPRGTRGPCVGSGPRGTIEARPRDTGPGPAPRVADRAPDRLSLQAPPLDGE